jgi:hypothetical protein
MPLVSVTRLRVRSWRYLPGFLVQSIRSARQAERASGSLAVSILRDADWAFWTRTVWRDEAAMRAFMQSGVHRRVMARLPDCAMRPRWCVGLKMGTSRHPGPRGIGAFKPTAGVQGSITRPRHRDGSKFVNRGRAMGLSSSDRWGRQKPSRARRLPSKWRGRPAAHSHLDGRGRFPGNHKGRSVLSSFRNSSAMNAEAYPLTCRRWFNETPMAYGRPLTG